MLATIFLTGHAFIGVYINIPNDLQDSTNSSNDVPKWEPTAEE